MKKNSVILGIFACSLTLMPVLRAQGSYTLRPQENWATNNKFAKQTDTTVTASFTASVSATDTSSVICIMNGPHRDPNFDACIVTVRFFQGLLQARNATGYPQSGISFTPGTSYAFRLIIDLVRHVWTGYVRAANAQSEQLLGSNIPFRSAQAQANTIDTWAAIVDGGVGTLSVADFQIDRDIFGIAKLNRTIPGGCEWFSASWHNGVQRALNEGSADPYDSYMIARGDGAVTVKGDGTAIMSGPDPRIYIEGCRFQNIELTMYSRRNAAGTPPSHAGLVAGVRSDHQLVTPTNDPCFGTGLYGRLHYSGGRATIIKELAHLGGDAGYTPERSRSTALSWDGSSTIGTIKFYGYKLVVRNTDKNGGVKVSLYRDLTEGFNGGQWEHVLTTTDAGGWSARTDVSGLCGIPNDKVLRNSGSAVLLRNSGIAETPYRWVSVREISPE